MSNMAYCRFRNTVQDLWDCHQNMEHDDDLDKYEQTARKQLIKLCVEIAEDFGYELEDDE